jgi:hypothetical protein
MSQTSICNLALLRLGIAQPIADITDASVSARACRAVYDHCLATMLRERPWSFAIRQVELVVVAEQTLGDWLYSYRYPTDFINIHRLVPSGQTSVATTSIYATTPVYQKSYAFAVGSDSQGRLLHSNLSPASAIGTVSITDVGLFDPMFSSALAWFIASEIALSLTKNYDIGRSAREEYERIVSDAMATAHNENKPDIDPDTDMIKARE